MYLKLEGREVRSREMTLVDSSCFVSKVASLFDPSPNTTH